MQTMHEAIYNLVEIGAAVRSRRENLGLTQDRLAILAKDAAQYGALLAERRIGLGATDEMGHQVRGARFRPRSGIAKPGKRGFDGAGISLATRAPEAIEVSLEGAGGDRQDRHGGHFPFIDVRIDRMSPEDDCVRVSPEQLQDRGVDCREREWLPHDELTERQCSIT